MNLPDMTVMDSKTFSRAEVRRYILEHHSGRLPRLVILGLVAQPAVEKLRTRWREQHTYTITVQGTDEIYQDLHRWVLARIPETDQRALIAVTGRDVHLLYDGNRVQTVMLENCRVEVSVCREEIPGGSVSFSENWRTMIERIVFTATNAQGRDAIVRMIKELVRAKRVKKGPPPLYMPTRYGDTWVHRSDLPPRTLESVILKDGQLEKLVADLQNFLTSEDDYNRMSQPWHRGYLFHGSPGTGKTTVAKALANHFGMPIYYLPLSDLKEDRDLMGFVSNVAPRSILLLEDIDVFHGATERSDENGTTTMAALLNALDGIWTPHGLITIMTTNDKGTLDPALIRDGRVDVDEEFTPLDALQARKLSQWVCGKYKSNETSRFVGRSPAEFIGELRSKYKKLGGTS